MLLGNLKNARSQPLMPAEVIGVGRGMMHSPISTDILIRLSGQLLSLFVRAFCFISFPISNKPPEYSIHKKNLVDLHGAIEYRKHQEF